MTKVVESFSDGILKLYQFLYYGGFFFIYFFHDFLILIRDFLFLSLNEPIKGKTHFQIFLRRNFLLNY